MSDSRSSAQNAIVLKPPVSARQYLERRFLYPVVMVAATDCAEAAVRKNGLSVAQLLRPFATLDSEAVVRIGDKLEMTTLSNFGCRISTPESLFEVPHDLRAAHFKSVLEDAHVSELGKGNDLDSIISRICQPPVFEEENEDGTAPVASATSRHPLLDMDQDVERRMKNQSADQFEERYFSLYETFARDYISLIRCSYFDTLDHPVCHFHVACTSAETTESLTQEALSSPNAMSALTSKVIKKLEAVGEKAHSVRANNPAMTNEVLKFYLVLHDESRSVPTLDQSKKIFESVRNAQTGNPCAFVVVNSNKPVKPATGTTAATAAKKAAANVDPDDPLGAKKLSPDQSITTGSVLLGADAASEAVLVPQIDPLIWVHANEAVDCYMSDSSKGTIPRVTYFQESATSTEAGDNDDSTNKKRVLTCAFMSRQDSSALKDAMQGFLRTKLLQHLSQRHQAISAFVSEHRQTGLSKVAAWFRSSDTKPKLPTFISGRNGMPSVYAAGSLEMTMRRLGDYSLFLRDFDTAANMYKYVRDDLVGYISSRDFNAPVVAAANEGMALCLYFLGRLQLPSPTKSGECRFEIARDEYVRHRTFSYGLRCALCMFLLCRGRALKPANDRAKLVASNITATTEIMHNRVIAGFMREMEALTTLFHASQEPSTRRALRKVARLMALAASDYSHSGQLQMTLKCLLRAQHIYRLHGVSSKSWCSIYDHVVAEIATTHLKLGNNIKAIGLFSSAASTGSSIFCQSATIANSNVKNFISQLKSLPLPDGIVPHLQLPNMVIARFTTYEARYSPDTVSKLEERMLGGTTALREWQSMEEPLKQHYSTHSLYIIPRMPKTLAQHSNGDAAAAVSSTRSRGMSIAAGGGNNALNENVSHRAGAGETLKIDVRFTNPVCIELELTDVCLCYINITAYDEANKDVPPSDRPLPEVLHAPVIPVITIPASPEGPPSQSASHFQLSTVHVELPFLESNRGFYKVVGVAWSVMGVRGRYLLSTTELERGKDETAFEYAMQHPYPPRHCDAYLTVHVTEPEARLSMEFDPPVPEILRDGGIHRCVLKITNHSTQVEASSLALMRNPCSAHWMYFEDFTFQENEGQDTPYVLMNCEKMNDDETALLTMEGALKSNIKELEFKAGSGGEKTEIDTLATSRSTTTFTRIPDKISAGETLSLRVTIRAAADGGGLGGVPFTGGGSAQASNGGAHHRSGEAASTFGPAFHIALMLGYFPGDDSTELSSPVSPIAPARNKFIRLHTLLRKVHLIGSLATASAIIPSTSIPRAITAHHITPSSAVNTLSMAGTHPLPFASGTLLITNRSDGVGAPIELCHVSCIHSPAWSIKTRFGTTRSDQEQAMNTLVDADGASLHTTTDQGVAISFEVSRAAAQASDQLVSDCSDNLGGDVHGASLETLYQSLLLPENARLVETVLLDERRSGSVSSRDKSVAGRKIFDSVHFCGDGVRTPQSGAEKEQFLDDMFASTPTGQQPQQGGKMSTTVVPPALWYAITHGLTTSGRVFGEVPPVNMDDFAFYVDRGATGTGTKRIKTNRTKQEKNSVVDKEQKRILEAVYSHNVARFGQVPAQFAPLCFVATWSSSENGAPVYGQTYHFVDALFQVSLAAASSSKEVFRQVVADRLESILGNVTPPILLTGSSSTRGGPGGNNALSSQIGATSGTQIYAAKKEVVIDAFRNAKSAAVYPLTSTAMLNSAIVEPHTPAGSVAIAPRVLPVSHAVVSIRARYPPSATLPSPMAPIPSQGAPQPISEVEVPVEVVVCNHSSLPVKLTVVAQSKGYSPNQLTNSYFSAAVTYSGNTSFKLVILPDHHITLPLTALLSSCGSFNLNTIKVELPQLVPHAPGMSTGSLPDDGSMQLSGGDDELALIRVEVAGLDAVWPVTVKRAMGASYPPSSTEDAIRRPDAPIRIQGSSKGSDIGDAIAGTPDSSLAPFTANALPVGTGFSPWWAPADPSAAFCANRTTANSSPFFASESHYSTCPRGCSVVNRPPTLKRNSHKLPVEVNSVMEAAGVSPASPRGPSARGPVPFSKSPPAQDGPPLKASVVSGARARSIDSSSSDSDDDRIVRGRARTHHVGSNPPQQQQPVKVLPAPSVNALPPPPPLLSPEGSLERKTSERTRNAVQEIEKHASFRAVDFKQYEAEGEEKDDDMAPPSSRVIDGEDGEYHQSEGESSTPSDTAAAAASPPPHPNNSSSTPQHPPPLLDSPNNIHTAPFGAPHDESEDASPEQYYSPKRGEMGGAVAAGGTGHVDQESVRRVQSSSAAIPPPAMELDDTINSNYRGSSLSSPVQDGDRLDKKPLVLESDIDSDDGLVLSQKQQIITPADDDPLVATASKNDEEQLLASAHLDPESPPPPAPRGTIGPSDDDSDDL